MTTDTATRIISKHESLVVLCTYNILFTNDICCWQIIECLQAMKRTPYYKHTFKKFLNDAEKARRAYEKTINSVIGADRGDFFADCNDRYLEKVNKHVEMLYWQFKQVLDNMGGWNIPQNLRGLSWQERFANMPACNSMNVLRHSKRKMLDSKDSHWNI